MFSLDNEYMPWVGDIEKIGEPSSNPDKVAHLADREEISRSDYLKLMNVRLHLFYGAGSHKDEVEPLQHFLLIEVTGGNKKSANLLFELVKGARLIISAPPDTPVAVVTKIRPAGAETIDWRLKRKVGASGQIEISLPYPTNSARYPVRADSYRISIAGSIQRLDISESDVSRGEPFFLQPSSSY